MVETAKVIVMIETSRDPGRHILRGITRYARQNGPWRFYMEPLQYMVSALGTKSLKNLKQWGADGIISRDLGPVKNQEIAEMGIPAIVSTDFEQTLHRFHTIVSDSYEIGKMGADYLLQRGFRYLAFCGYEDIYWSQLRQRGFADVLNETERGCCIYEQPKDNELKHWDNELPFMVQWLKSLPKPVGLMACNDDRGQNVFEACSLCGFRIPEDVAILGVDNDEFVCSLTDVPMSSIAVNFEKAGFEAAKLLDRLMGGEALGLMKIIAKPLHVISRQSTDIMAVEDEQLSKALNFVHENARRSIRVKDVVDSVNISRRSLENRFRNVLGRSILDEIRRIRVDEFAKMLLDTNLSVSDIAKQLDFARLENVSRYFKKEKGITPYEYRKKYTRK